MRRWVLSCSICGIEFEFVADIPVEVALGHIEHKHPDEYERMIRTKKGERRVKIKEVAA